MTQLSFLIEFKGVGGKSSYKFAKNNHNRNKPRIIKIDLNQYYHTFSCLISLDFRCWYNQRFRIRFVIGILTVPFHQFSSQVLFSSYGTKVTESMLKKVNSCQNMIGRHQLINNHKLPVYH